MSSSWGVVGCMCALALAQGLWANGVDYREVRRKVQRLETAVEQGRLREALERVNIAAIRFGPFTPWYLCTCGEAYRAMGQCDLALAAFRAARDRLARLDSTAWAGLEAKYRVCPQSLQEDIASLETSCSGPPDPLEGAHGAFCRDMLALAKRGGARLRGWWSAPMGAGECVVAQFCHNSCRFAEWYVVQAERSRSLVSVGGSMPRCDLPLERHADSLPRFYLTQERELWVSDGYARWESHEGLAFRDGKLVVVRQRGSSHSVDSWRTYACDWDELIEERHQGWLGEDEADVDSVRYAITPICAPKVRSDTTTTFNNVLYGKQRWNGASDASVQVRASRESDSLVALSVWTTDDITVSGRPGMTDREFLGIDHLELWYQQWWSRADSCREWGDSVCVRQLGVARLDDGSLDCRWLYPPHFDGELPRVRTTEKGVRVLIPFRASWRSWMRFTAVFSDCDDPRKRQQTLVATSMLTRGDASTMGLVKVVGEGERWIQQGEYFAIERLDAELDWPSCFPQ